MLRLIPIKDDDETVSYYEKWFNDPVIRKYLNPKTPRKRTGIRKWLHKVHNSKKYDYQSIILEGKNIGHTGMTREKNSKGKTYFVYSIVIGDRNCLGRGVGTRVTAKRVKEYFGKKTSETRAKIRKDNFASIKMTEKFGFRPYYHTKDYVFVRKVV